MAGRQKRQFTFMARIAEEPMPAEEWQAAERLLAKLVARAYAADHPDLLQARRTESTHPKSSGPPATAAAVAGALPASAGGPERESREHDTSKDLSTE
jgi:hypothetical protein